MATRYYPAELTPLLQVLRDDGVSPIIVPDAFDHGPDWSLYRLWNQGLAIASVLGHEYVVVMNDDVQILPGTVPALTQALMDNPSVGVTYPDTRVPLEFGLHPHGLMPTIGTWGRDAMTGFCFAFRTRLQGFDVSYRWWYGDDDFEERVRAKGLSVCRVEGVPIRHQPGRSAQRDWEALSALVAADRALWADRHASEPHGPSQAPTEALAV
jgi:GT2 family glycosyltransferase